MKVPGPLLDIAVPVLKDTARQVGVVLLAKLLTFLRKKIRK